ncbi:MAG: hypothetical protein LUC90_07630 [Lachnospiraceae bacterium]|nr:hypothetical protein [Lachnospiraceae bacterium]
MDAYAKEGIILDTFRPCYAALKCVRARGKLRVYVQVTVEGRACPKKKKDGSPRHDFSKTGPVGCDIGTQSVAAVSKDGMILDNLAERDHKSTRESEKLERRLLRKMDRSRRAMNPDNYNEDGTVKPRSQRQPWIYSKSYLKTKEQHTGIARKNADSRKFANREIANNIRSMGDILITEPKNAGKLKRKAKEPKVTVREDGTKKFSRRKRFGRSIQNRCPGQFQEELKHKFRDAHYIVVPSKYRASQYDHTANQFIKKELNQRMYSLSDGTKVQRDLYSAYLLMHPDGEIKFPDYVTCKSDFSTFKTKMDVRIKEIKASGYKVCNSGI